MTNLFELMNQAQGGNAMANLANQYGLNQQQMQKAMEALLPAFSLGLERQAATPSGFEQLLNTFGQGQYANYYDSDGDGIPDTARTSGNDVLAQLFGSPDMSRAVAQQAAAMSGVSDSILKQMLPVIATMVMGGLFKGAMGQGLGGLLGHMMQGGFGGMLGQGLPQSPGQTGFPGNASPMGQGNPFPFPGFPGNVQAAPPPQQPPQPQNPFGNAMGGGALGGLLGTIMGSMMGARAPEPPPPPPPQPADPMSASLDILKGMFQSGAQVQQGYQNSLQDLFNQFQQNQRR
jgi:hypothetical protein